MSISCVILDRPAQPVLSVRTVTTIGDLPRVLGGIYGAVGHHLGVLGECPAGPPFAAYYNMDMEALDVEAGFPVARMLSGEGDVEARDIPAGRAATCVHVGPYGEMEETYAELTAWIASEGHEPTGTVYEFYLNDPGKTPPEELETMILFPLKPV